jgi:hypothetical protein
VKPSLLFCALATVATSAIGLATPAQAASTDAAALVCDDTTVTVNGFGRGQVLHVVEGAGTFIVTQAVSDGRILFEAPGQAGRANVVTCATTSPSGRSFTFQGFFTPRT